MGRILFLVRSLEGGGAERQLMLLAAGLRRRGHDVTIAVYYAGGAYEAEIEATGVRYVSLEKRGFGDLVGFFRRAVRLARHLEPDIVHGYMDVGNCVALALRPFVPRTRIVWGIRASKFDMSEYDLAGRLLSHILVPASRFVDLVICNSKAGALDVERHGYPHGKIVTVPNGVDTDVFHRRPSERERLRTSWGIASDQVLVGLAARPDPMKDYGTFVAAAKILAAEYPQARFACAGDWVEPYRSAALNTIRTSGLGDALRWHGFVRDMPAFYSALDILTSSSAFGEGVPNSVAEAMACGVPCVATDVGDSRDVVGDCGIIVPPRRPEALAVGWKTLLERRSPELSTACRNRILQEYSVEVLIGRTEHVLGLNGHP